MQVKIAHSGEEGLQLFKNQDFDLCILDVKMPFKDGFMVAEEIRRVSSSVPFIFLSGQQQKEDKIRGLMLGADDYISKPFSMEEVWLRVGIVLRRFAATAASAPTTRKFSIGKFSFDAISRELSIDNQLIVKLSATESKLLELFCQSETGVLDRDTALRKVWDDDAQLFSRSLNVYVSKLRQYLNTDPSIEILNIHGEGYRMVLRS